MKHLQIQGEAIPGENVIKPTILQMTHFGMNFCGRRDARYSSKRSMEPHKYQFISSNGVRLRSDGSGFGVSNKHVPPARFGGIFTFYLPTSDKSVTAWNLRSVLMTPEEWEHLKIAVNEYNEYFKGDQ